MKKFLGIIFFGLLLSGCAPNMNHLVFNKTFSERVQLILDRHARVNLFKGDENKIYLNNKFGTMPFGYTTDINEVAQRICVEKFNFKTAKHVGSRVMTKTEIEELEKSRRDENKVIFTSAPRKDLNRGMRFMGCSDPINKGKLGSSRSFIKKKDKEYY